MFQIIITTISIKSISSILYACETDYGISNETAER